MQLSAFNSWFTFLCLVLHNAVAVSGKWLKYAGSGADKLLGSCQDRDSRGFPNQCVKKYFNNYWFKIPSHDV